MGGGGGDPPKNIEIFENLENKKMDVRKIEFSTLVSPPIGLKVISNDSPELSARFGILSQKL